jgi:hypothetical protein
MDLSGSSTKFRSIYLDESEFLLDVVFDREPTNIDFGLSGQYSTQKISIKSGKVLDNSGKLIDVFNSGNKYSIIGKKNNVNYASNDRVLSIYSDPLIFSGDCYLYYTNRSASTESASFSLKTKSPTISYRTGTTLDSLNFTGEIVNESSKNFRFFEFSGEGITTGTHSPVISGGSTGQFTFSTADTGVTDGSFLIDFIYNFGEEEQTIQYRNITPAPSATGYINTSYAGPINNSSTSVDVSYFWEEDSNLEITFDYVYGSGNIYEGTTIFDAFGSGNYSGLVNKVGSIYSTDLAGTGNYSFIYNEVNFTGQSTGINGNGTWENVVATGEVSWTVLSFLVGYESGVLATGGKFVTLTKYLDESYSGQYEFPSGFYTGTPGVSQYGAGTPAETFSSPTGIYTGTYVGGLAELESYITLYGSGVMTDAITNILVGSKTLTNTWNIFSGKLGETGVDFLANSMYSGNRYSGRSTIPSGLNYLQIGIDYTNPHDFTYDSGTLTISNGFLTETLQIYA